MALIDLIIDCKARQSITTMGHNNNNNDNKNDNNNNNNTRSHNNNINVIVFVGPGCKYSTPDEAKRVAGGGRRGV